MAEKAIGIFDSGLGGLTCVRRIEKLLPGQKIVFFGDTGRLPYGGRSKDTIIRYTTQDLNFLKTFDLKLIVAACGTVSTMALDEIKKASGIPLLGVVEPSVKQAVSATKTKRIGVIGTAATISSGAYERHINALMSDAEVFSKACPLFVPLVENGHYRSDDAVVMAIVEEYLSELKANNIDTLILGCTHYPLLRQAIEKFFGPDVTLIDSGAACANEVENVLTKMGISPQEGSEGGCRFFVSDRTGDFASLASIFLGRAVDDSDVGLVDIYSY